MDAIFFGNGSDIPHYEAHRNFITGSDQVSFRLLIYRFSITKILIKKKQSACGYVFQVPFEQRCDFVRETEDCHDMVNFIDYMNFLFCTLSGVGTFFGIALMVSDIYNKIFLFLTVLVRENTGIKLTSH